MNKLSTENLHLIPKYDELKQLCYSYINDYCQGAFESQKLKAEAVALIYQQQILTEELARKINPSLVNVDRLRKDVEEVGCHHAL